MTSSIHKTIVVVIIIIFSQFQACNKNNPAQPQNNSNLALASDLSKVTSIQDSNCAVFSNLKSHGFSDSIALDSVVAIFKTDTAVSWAARTLQGIAVKYKNGLNGGIMVNAMDNPMPNDSIFLDSMIKYYIPGLGKRNTTTDVITPVAGKRTIFINPSYACRKMYSNRIQLNEPNIFTRTGHNTPEIVLGSDATVSRFSSLSGYGYIHIYSHGMIDTFSGTEHVWLMTGENASDSTLQNYPESTYSVIKVFHDSAIVNGVKVECDQGENRIFIGPSIIANRTIDFSKDSTIIYGGFCFSGLGSWKTTMVNVAHAAAYIGFDWSVDTRWNANWSLEILDRLTDTNWRVPMTLAESFSAIPHGTCYPTIESPKEQVCLVNFGLASAHLWKRFSVYKSESWLATLSGYGLSGKGVCKIYSNDTNGIFCDGAGSWDNQRIIYSFFCTPVTINGSQLSLSTTGTCWSSGKPYLITLTINTACSNGNMIGTWTQFWHTQNLTENGTLTATRQSGSGITP